MSATVPSLPSLPPAFRVTDDDVRPGGRSVIELLADEHHEISALCDRLRESADGDPATVRRLADVLVATVSRHLSAEEQYLYPAVRTALAGGADLVDRELTADMAMLRTLRQLHRTPADDQAFPGIVDTAARQLHRHVRRAARETLPGLREGCSDNELVRLGNRVEIAQEAAPTRPHPATPVTPPANKIVDPAVGVLDKLRDALSRRATWPGDL